MALVLASGPGVETPTSGQFRVWVVAVLMCAIILLADAAFTGFAMRRRHTHMWRRVPTLLPLTLACACLLVVWRAWLTASAYPNAPQVGGVTGSCALCQTMESYVWLALFLIGATLFTVLGGVVYLLGEL